MKNSGFSLLRINGINVIIDLTWLVLFLLIPYTAIKFAQMYPDLTLISDWIIGGVVSVLVFCCALIHGLTQALAAAKFGTKVKHIRLHIFGCLVVPESRSARQEFVITLVGWATSIVSGFFFLAIYVYLSIQQYIHPIRGIAGFLAYANFILAAIHMIPGLPLESAKVELACHGMVRIQTYTSSSGDFSLRFDDRAQSVLGDASIGRPSMSGGSSDPQAQQGSGAMTHHF